jgi:hypothetical protein
LTRPCYGLWMRLSGFTGVSKNMGESEEIRRDDITDAFLLGKGTKKKRLLKYVKRFPQNKEEFFTYSLMELMCSKYRKVFPEIAHDDYLKLVVYLSQFVYEALENPEKREVILKSKLFEEGEDEE